MFCSIRQRADASGETADRLLSPPAEGRVMRGYEGMDVGERVRVKLVSTDPVKGFIDFEGTGN